MAPAGYPCAAWDRNARLTGQSSPEATTSRANPPCAAPCVANTRIARAHARAHAASRRARTMVGPNEDAAKRVPRSVSALRVPAIPALRAALFEDEGAPALRALRVEPAFHEVRRLLRLLLDFVVDGNAADLRVERVDRRDRSRPLHSDVPLDRLRNRVRDREDPLPVVQCEARAADPLELVDDLVHGHAGPEAQGHEPRDPLREARGVPAAPPDLREQLEEPLAVLVHGDVQRAVAREDLLRAARDDVRPLPGAGDEGRLRG